MGCRAAAVRKDLLAHFFRTMSLDEVLDEALDADAPAIN